jgi:pimeloyl-ACP methyl ester carboxylesterase
MSPITEIVPLGAGRSLCLLRGGASDGTPTVLIHGAMTTHVDWLEAPFAAFAERGPVIAVDRPGHGASARPRYDAAPLAQARQIRAGLAALGVDGPPRLVAHSYGGLVGLAWAAAWPDEVAGLLLLAPIVRPEFRAVEHTFLAPRAAPLIGPLFSELARRTVDPVLLRVVQKLMFSPADPPVDWLARFPDEAVLRVSQMVEEGEDAASVLPGSPAGTIDVRRIRAPVHILNGRQDKIVDHKRQASVLAELLPQAELTLLDGVGHMVHHIALSEVLRAFDAISRSTGREPASTKPARSAAPPPPA